MSSTREASGCDKIYQYCHGYAERGQQVELIKLRGSELAPSLGLADAIVDIVDTGKTLKANGLVPKDTIADISSRHS